MEEIIGFRKVGKKDTHNTENNIHSLEDVVVAELFHGPTLAFKVLVNESHFYSSIRYLSIFIFSEYGLCTEEIEMLLYY